jgi:hypothetical protein
MLCSVTTALISISSPSVAQQNTVVMQNNVKQCLDEWRANRAENKAQVIKKKDYIAQCRDGFVSAAAVTLAAAPATSPDTVKPVTRRSLRKPLPQRAPGYGLQHATSGRPRGGVMATGFDGISLSLEGE